MSSRSISAESEKKVTGSIARRSVLLASASTPLVLSACSDETEPLDDAVQSASSSPTKASSAKRPVSAAMHVHSSFSEGAGSMEAQLAEATRLGIDVLWWTDHDWRMQAVGYWDEVTFEGQSQSRDGKTWRWEPQAASANTATADYRVPPTPQSAGGGSTTPQSAGGGSTTLYLSQRQSAGAAEPYAVKAIADRLSYRTSLHGQRFGLEVYPEELSDAGFLSFDIVTSYRPDLDGRPAGTYRLSYRFGGSEAPGRVALGLVGVITLDAPLGQWSSFTLEPTRDLEALWPDLVGDDAASFEIKVTVSAGSTGTTAGYFGSLTIERADISGDEPLATQQSLMTHYESDFPQVTQLLGLEISLNNPHIGAYGDDVTIPIAAGGTAEGRAPADDSRAVVAQINTNGGIACYNHPFGTSNKVAPAAQQDDMVRNVATDLVTQRALGCDMVEVGYRARGGADLQAHARVWDACSVAGIFLTGIGVNDNHSGTGWDTAQNNFVTWIWAAETSSQALIASLRSGHAYFGDPVLFTGSLDLESASGARMGQAVVSPDHGSTLTVKASDLPADASLEVLILPIDLSGSAQAPLDGDYARVTLAASDFTEGMAAVPIEASSSAVYRTVVTDATGQTIALSNPIWLMTSEPADGIPEARRAI